MWGRFFRGETGEKLCAPVKAGVLLRRKKALQKGIVRRIGFASAQRDKCI